MSTRDQMADRHGAVLGELSELGLVLARKVQGQALAAEEVKAVADFVLAFHRASRSVRQTLALEARLERDRARCAREAQADAAREAETRTTVRKRQVHAIVERMIWTEAEGPETEAEALVDRLEEILDEEALMETFGDEPLEAHVARLRADLGLPAAPAADDAAAETPAEAAQAGRRSSG